MSTKDQVLEALSNNPDSFVSGESLADQLQISRTAVWKAISSLRESGCDIEAVRNRGYRLVGCSDTLSAEGIQAHLSSTCPSITVEVLNETESTNADARKRAREGAAHGHLVVANAQTKGKGRRGKSFFSPANSGLYMSLVLRPNNMSIAQAAKITTMAAVAVCRAIESVSDANARIKWVNDVFIDGKKVCGILTEASCNMESGCLDYAVLGVGVNAYASAEELPDELKPIVGHVFNERLADGRNRLAAAFLNHFMEIFNADSEWAESTASTEAKSAAANATPESAATAVPAYVEEYRRRCFVVGKPVTLLSPNGNREAWAVDVDNDCRLIVRYEDDSQEALNSGEISVRVSE